MWHLREVRNRRSIYFDNVAAFYPVMYVLVTPPLTPDIDLLLMCVSQIPID
jgi:hypothetical protein